MKRSLFVLVVVLAMLLSACSGNGGSTAKTRPTSNSKESNSLNLAISTQTTTLDPQNFALNVEDGIIIQMYEPLFYTDNQGEFHNVLATGMDVAEDGSSVTFTVDTSVKFHSGDTLTAEDVAYTFERGAVSAITGVLNQYSTCTVVDDATVRFDFPYAAYGASFYEVYTYFEALNVVNKSYCEQFISTPTDNLYYNVDGTGAYYLDKVDVNGDVTIKKFADYHGEASIETVNYKVVTGDASLAFQSGDLDYVGVEASKLPTMKEYSNVGVYSISANYVAFTTVNAAGKFADMSLRQAVVYAMNKNDIATIASGGAGETAYNLANPLVTYYADCCEHYDRDVEKSKSLLSGAGYSESSPMEVTLIVMSAQSDWVAAAQIMKENLEESYFKVTIEEVADTTKYFTGEFDLAFIGVGLTTSFTSFSMLYSDDGLNLCGVSGTEQEAILAAFAAIVDEETTHTAMKTVVDSLTYIPAYYTTSYYVHDADLTVGEVYNDVSASFLREYHW